ncbi:chemotaxis protein CheW [Marivirga sp. S37H4]|uniref:Chemotaxis protein CheW n=1 Tax=Marivirga aurantiaca TaxID=2802615 RepID=A0A935CA07_9BACT|nr:chemotaxis protein CheW [Marivirga aurantiaca]MBK6264553.1 chemotaxis protein CheW [Marivirga aurantiaca]
MEQTATMSTKAYLTFSLGKESFALTVDSVIEILELSTITEVPQSPHFMRGIINLRGNVLPVVDTRIKFGLPTAEDTLKTRIIVLNVKGKNGSIQVGAVVDVASQVMDFKQEEILPAPSLEDYERAEFIDGIIKYKEQFIMILNAQKLFGSQDVEMLEETQLS